MDEMMATKRLYAQTGPAVEATDPLTDLKGRRGQTAAARHRINA